MDITLPAAPFDAAAVRVLTRVMLRRWLAMVTRTLAPALGVLGLLVVLEWAGLLGAGIVFGLAVLWLAAMAAWTWKSQPGKYEALALWDQAGQRSEAFAAAWWFGQQAQLSEMQRRHVEVQTAVLDKALPGLARDLPLPLSRRLWLLPALLAAASLASAFHRGSVREASLTEGMKQTALQEAKGLAHTDWDKKKLQGLTEQEKKDLEKLKQDVKTTAGDLQSAAGKTPRDVLDSLEKRAREAEKLAQRLGGNEDAWASTKLIAEMRRHADTADLGDAAATHNASQTARAATDLAGQLRAPGLALEVQDRLSETLKEVRKQAEETDRKRTVGGHVLAAGNDMAQGRVLEAAQEFEALAKAMQDLARRDEAKKEMEKLAQQLRDAGSRIAGSQGGGMQQMAAAGQSASQAQASSSAGEKLSAQSLSQSQTPLAAPGFNPPPTMMQQPPSSMGSQQQGQMQMAQGQPGQSSNKDGKPMLFAPVPGAKPQQPPSTVIMGKDPGQDDPQSPSIALSVGGGLQAGNGTAKLDAAPTAAQKAKNNSQVDAARSGEGPSSSRSVEGGVRAESATRDGTQVTVDFIKQQEEALDDAALPPGRREQVRRYFTELRKRFEAAEK